MRDASSALGAEAVLCCTAQHTAHTVMMEMVKGVRLESSQRAWSFSAAEYYYKPGKIPVLGNRWMRRGLAEKSSVQ